MFEYDSELFMVTVHDTETGGSQEGREWRVGVGVGGVGGTIRLWRTALFYGGIKGRAYQVASRGWRV